MIKDRLPGMARLLLRSIATLAATLVLLVFLLTGTEAGTAWLVNKALERVSGSPGLEVAVSGLEGTLFSELSARELNVTAGGTRVSAGNLRLAWNPVSLAGSTLAIRELSTSRLQIRLQGEEDAPAVDMESQLAALFNLPLAVEVDGLSLEGIDMTGDTTLSLQSVAGRVSLDRDRLAVDLAVRQSPGNAMAMDLTLTAGDWGMDGSIDWQAAVQDLAMAGTLDIGGTLRELALDHRLSAPVTVRSVGTLAPGLLDNSAPMFNLNHEISPFGSAALNLAGFDTARGTFTMAGAVDDFSLTGDAVVEVPDLGQLALSLDTGVTGTSLAVRSLAVDSDRFTMRGDGTVDFAPELAVALNWTLADFSDGDLLPRVALDNLAGNGALTVRSENGEMEAAITIGQLDGRLNDYALTGNGNITLAGGTVREVGLNLESGGNALRLDGALVPALAMRWTLQAPALNRVLPDLNGVVTGQGMLTGTPDAPRVNGTLTGKGLDYRDGEMSVRIESIDGDASYQGEENRIGLAFSGLQVDTPSFQAVQNRGEVTLSGTPANHVFHLETRDSIPALLLDGEGQWRDGSWQGVLDTARIDSAYGNWQLREPAGLALAATRANLDRQCWRMTAVSLCLDAVWSPDGGLEGSLQADNLPLAWFNGNLPANVAGLERVRSSLENRPAGITRELQRYALFMPENSLLEGILDIDASFSGVGLEPDTMTLSAELTPTDLGLGLFRPVTDEVTGLESLQVERYGLDDVMLNVSRADNRWQVVSGLSVFLAESGGLDFQGDFRGQVSLDDDEALDGNFELTFNNVAWVEALMPSLRNVSGVLAAGGHVGGKLQRPLLQVDATLEEGSVQLPAYGLTLTDVGLRFHSEGENEMTLDGMARSGDGDINLTSRITTPFLPERALQMTVSGENFLAYDRPVARVLVNPGLDLEYRDNIMRVDGTLDVPSMQVDLDEGEALTGSGAVDVSRDAVIVTTPDGNPPKEADASERLGRIPLTGNVRLGMGDDVKFKGVGLDLELTGNLMLEQTVDRPLLALGELSIPTGSYALYGQRLSISDGKLLFLGNPMNPALDIQATRQTPKAEVGILMNGTINHINAQLFSTPSLPESEILSLLITGNSFSSLSDGNSENGQNMLGAIALLGLEKGQGLTGSVSSKLGLDTVAISSGNDYRDSALGLGKYISPNLFMRYDIGLFDRENVLTLDYSLTDRIKLEVENGVSQSVDLTYTVEK